MAEERRLETTEIREAVDRDSRAEALLVEGLDRYFAGRYDDAIHIWTRVLFLDRSHARARAYIDRARTAVAEGQRRAEEMLQTTGDLIAAGDTHRARVLLSKVVGTMADDERAAALRVLLERVERAGVGGAAGRQAIVDAVRVRPHAASTGRSVAWYAAGGGVIALALFAMAMTGWSGWTNAPAPLPSVRTFVELPALSTSEAAIVRARTLYARGRLAEALRALDRVDPDSANRTLADGLRVEIQQVLLAAARENRRTGSLRTAGVR
jgi:tetratricopeptide (TPR) repeat protein